ncbi:hypothetical protein [Thiohalomonas denitrificans]|uniref:hypothetical protein n=1 Tax=Thiohalomonas denitrificans TaxID=415747 RepID=UPI0026F13D01|nr:hypothetical protein [Thiohalomonas denitrificans]
MPELDFSMEQLRGMIGIEVKHRGIPCRVIEVLDDGPTLVLQDLNRRDMQTDQYGDPRRRVPATYTVPVLDTDCRSIHPDFLGLDLQ